MKLELIFKALNEKVVEILLVYIVVLILLIVGIIKKYSDDVTELRQRVRDLNAKNTVLERQVFYLRHVGVEYESDRETKNQ